MRTLRKNPQGLRYNELYRRSGEEYGRVSGDQKGINIKTFDKHLKWLVSEQALERIEEKRSRVLYRLAIPASLKVYAETSRNYTEDVVKKLKESRARAAHTQFPESLVGLMMEFIGYSVKSALLMGLELSQENPVLGRYWVDEEMETTRYFFNEVSPILGKQENIKDLHDRLDVKWYEQYKRYFESFKRDLESLK